MTRHQRVTFYALIGTALALLVATAVLQAR